MSGTSGQSVFNCSFKIITKVLANRSKSKMELHIDKSQSTFIKDRYILDSVACAQEIIATVHAHPCDAIFLKLDFEKAFNSLDWSFLVDVLLARGFGFKWRGWMLACLQSATSSVLVNGDPGSQFHCMRGLRQVTHYLPISSSSPSMSPLRS